MDQSAKLIAQSGQPSGPDNRSTSELKSLVAQAEAAELLIFLRRRQWITALFASLTRQFALSCRSDHTP